MLIMVYNGCFLWQTSLGVTQKAHITELDLSHAKIKCQVEGGPHLFIGVVGDDAARAAPVKNLEVSYAVFNTEANYGEPGWPS
jgi:hypothetical protein